MAVFTGKAGVVQTSSNDMPKLEVTQLLSQVIQLNQLQWAIQQNL
ncbi:MAG: hypothetical protein CM15mV144_340 [Caudoviricetes sp.]|nr:MAG: hypothetical protein CM15mV144_340 [Caudoviricetes sp.]